MFAKLILVAEKIAFDDTGRITAHNLLLDTVQPSFPAVMDSMDLLTLWNRAQDEPSKQIFELALQIDGEVLPPEHIPIDFGDGYEAYQGISLDGFEIAKPGAIVFRFTQHGEDRGVWIMRNHVAASGEVGEAK